MGATGLRTPGIRMKWVTRERAKVDRIACPWLITRFVDPKAEFRFVPKEKGDEVADREGGIPFDPPGVELTHYRGGGADRPGWGGPPPPGLALPTGNRPVRTFGYGFMGVLLGIYLMLLGGGDTAVVASLGISLVAGAGLNILVGISVGRVGRPGARRT